MNTHYIPCLLLRHFATREHINTYNFTTKSFEQKKLKNTFSEMNLFDEKLERLFASKLEGPFGNLLIHKLLNGEVISLDRQENLLLRKFLMINFLRASIVNSTWDEMIERTKLQEYPSVQVREFLLRHHQELKAEFDEMTLSEENYISKQGGEENKPLDWGIVQLYRTAGFVFIEEEPIYDLTFGWLKKMAVMRVYQ